MASAQSGDHEAYRALLVEVSAILHAFLRRRLADPDEVADVVQETLMTLHYARNTYDPARPFDPWMFTIARHVLIDHVRRRARGAGIEQLADVDLPDVAAPEPALSDDRLFEALEQLPHAQREAFVMLKLDGLSVAAAAARVGVSPGALKVRAHRAYKAVRALLSSSS
jgi:RNA polymerase sigma-70 factor (ECF subfamily)